MPPSLGVSMCASQACVLPYPKVISFTPKGTAFTSKGGNPQKQLCLYLSAHSPCQLAQTLQAITIGAPVAVALVAGMCCVGALRNSLILPKSRFRTLVQSSLMSCSGLCDA